MEEEDEEKERRSTPGAPQVVVRGGEEGDEGGERGSWSCADGPLHAPCALSLHPSLWEVRCRRGPGVGRGSVGNRLRCSGCGIPGWGGAP